MKIHVICQIAIVILISSAAFFIASCKQKTELVPVENSIGDVAFTYGISNQVPDSLEKQFGDWIINTLKSENLQSSESAIQLEQQNGAMLDKVTENGVKLFSKPEEGLIATSGKTSVFISQKNMSPEQLKIFQRVRLVNKENANVQLKK